MGLVASMVPALPGEGEFLLCSLKTAIQTGFVLWLLSMEPALLTTPQPPLFKCTADSLRMTHAWSLG